MVFKFYEYDNLDIVPNKLKSAKLIKSIDIYAPQIITPLGCNITTKENISANIAEYTHQGVKYVCYCTFTGMGNNMYNYRLDVDALATAWYNNCFDRYNMVARSNLGTFKNDNALLRDTQAVIQQDYIQDLTTSYYVLITVIYPVFTSLATGNAVSGQGTRTYLATPAQFNSFYQGLIDYVPGSQESTLADYIKSILTMYILPASLVNDVKDTLFTSDERITLYAVTGAHKINKRQFGDPSQGSPKKLSDNVLSSYEIIKSTNVTNLAINEDTIMGNISINTSFNANMQIPISTIPKTINRITSVGYSLKLDYRTGSYIVIPVINGSTYMYDLQVGGEINSSFPFLYDETIYNWESNISRLVGQVGMAVGGASMMGVFTPNNGSITQKTPGGSTLHTFGTSLLKPGIAGGMISGAVGMVANAYADYVNSVTTGSTAIFNLAGQPRRTSFLPTTVIISYTPTVNKQAYQDRFGKADMTSRNITQLNGPVQTINCIASMNNLNQSIIQSATNQCDNGIWIL